MTLAGVDGFWKEMCFLVSSIRMVVCVVERASRTWAS
jgi:hypothetical protein